MTSSRLYPERPFLAASVAVLRDGKVLLAARANPPAARVFSLPGGVVEPGETLAEAALRELREEVGVEAEMLGFIAPVEVIERDEADAVRRHFVVCAHAARWRAGEPTIGAEALELLWLGEDEIASLGTEGGPAATPGLGPILAGAFALAAR
jgi:ADP-ribose pyrophosphatase YjhB (NUDIX family)